MIGATTGAMMRLSVIEPRSCRTAVLLIVVAAIVSLQLVSVDVSSFPGKISDRELSGPEASKASGGEVVLRADNAVSNLSELATFSPGNVSVASDVKNSLPLPLNTTKAVKPALLLHVGPPKSGTTTLEYGLGKFREEMQQDGLFHCDTRAVSYCRSLASAFKKCGTKDTAELAVCWSTLKQDLWHLHVDKGHVNLFFSPISIIRHPQRGMNGRMAPIDWVSLKKHLGDDFDIKVMFGYRRYADWLPSAIQQIERSWSKRNWPGEGSDSGPKHEGLFPSRWRTVRAPGAIKYMHTHELVKSLNGTLPYILFNIHEQFEIETASNTQSESLKQTKKQASLLSRFACETLLEAGLAVPTTCENSLFQDMIGTTEVVKNPSITLYYDALAVAALEKGFIANHTAIRRKDAEMQAQEFHEHTLSQTLRDFPLICMTHDENQKYLDFSLAIEQRLLPEFYHSPQGKTAHTQEFWENVNMNKYCWIDTDKVLEEERWQRFFLGMKPAQSKA